MQGGRVVALEGSQEPGVASKASFSSGLSGARMTEVRDTFFWLVVPSLKVRPTKRSDGKPEIQPSLVKYQCQRGMFCTIDIGN